MSCSLHSHRELKSTVYAAVRLYGCIQIIFSKFEVCKKSKNPEKAGVEREYFEKNVFLKILFVAFLKNWSGDWLIIIITHTGYTSIFDFQLKYSTISTGLFNFVLK